MSGRKSKTYGLIIRKKPSSTPIKLSIFGNDSSSDEEEKGRKIVNNTIKKEAEKNKQIRQTQIEMAKVLEEDPTAYDYDKVYDKMAENKASLVAAKKATAEKKPKYIGNLLKFAEVRKKEEERRVERQVQKEREDEGNEFANKDAFVTSAYRRKIQEMAEDEERQRRLDALEGDVTKQADLSMFYRNLLDKNLSTTGTHNSEDQSTTDETHRPPDVESTKNESSEKVEHSENNDKREDVDENDRERKRKERSGRDHERRQTSEQHQTVSDKSERFREKDEPQRRKPSPEMHARHEKEKRPDEENTSPREAKRAEDGQETSRDEGGQCEKKEQMEERKDKDKIKTTAEKRGFNEHKSDERGNDDKDVSKGRHEESKFAKHSSKETVLSAKERYLARKNARVVVKATSDDENE